MVISKAAVEDFLNRKLADSARVKRLSKRALDRKIAALDPKPRFEVEPWKHQLASFLLGVKYGYYLYLLDMGTGKTKLSLDLIRYFRRLGYRKTALVLVPLGINLPTWMDEVRLHAPELYARSTVLDCPTEQKWRVLEEQKPPVAICTYAGFLRMVAEDGKGKMKVSRKKAARLASLIDQIFYDEISFIKNHRSATFKAASAVGSHLCFRFGLTGTPLDKDPQDLWSQFYAIDYGETLGPTLGLFRAAFFEEKQSYWGRGFDYKFKEEMRGKLHRIMRHRSIRYSEEECDELPPLIRQVVKVEFSDEAKSFYRDLIEEMQSAHGNFSLLENVYTRMRQMTAGFLRYRDPEGELHEIVLRENPKLDALVELLRQVPEDCKALVFHEFQLSGKFIIERLKKEKIKALWLYGKSKDKTGITKQFSSDPKVKVLVCSRAAAFGANLQVANYAFLYESPDSSIVRKQMIKRTHRGGQKKTVHIYDLVVKGSIDEKVLRYVERGESLFQALVEGKEKL